MWPKAFAQFVELAPHVSRLLPLADRFFQQKANSDEAERKTTEALQSLSESLRGELKEVSTANADLHTTMLEVRGKLDGFDGGVGAKVDALAERVDLLNASLTTLATGFESATARIERVTEDVRGARVSAETLEARLAKVEGGQGRLTQLLGITLALVVVVLILLALLLSRGH